MKTKNLVTLVIACVLVACITILCCAGLRMGKNILIPAAQGITRGDEFQERDYIVFTVSEKVEESLDEADDESTAAAASEEAESDSSAEASEETIPNDEEAPDFSELYSDTLSIIRKRAGLTGIAMGAAQQGSDKIRVEWPKYESIHASDVIEVFTRTGHVYFADEDGNTILEGSHITQTNIGYNENSRTYTVSIILDEEGSRELAEAPEKASGSNLIIYSDSNQILSRTITEVMTGTFGFNSYSSAVELYSAFMSGELKTTVTADSNGTIPAPVSESQYNRIMITLGLCLLIVLIAVIVIYKAPGFAVALSTILFADCVIYFYGLVPYMTLGFAGVFGLIASVALKLYCDMDLVKRVNTQLSLGVLPKSAVKTAFRTGIKRAAEFCGVSIALSLLMQYLGSASVGRFTSVYAISSLIAFVIYCIVTRLLLSCVADLKAEAAGSR